MITLNCLRLIIRYSFQSYFLQRSIYLCRTYKFLTNYFSHCAVWILCVISLERAAVTRRLVRNQNVFNHKHSYCTLVIIYTSLFCLNIHYLIFFGSHQEKTYPLTNNHTAKKSVQCSSNSDKPAAGTYDHFLTAYFSWMDFIINSVIPFLIIFIANASVMHSVCKSRVLMQQLGIRQTGSPRDTQLAYILFTSTFLFLLLTFPSRVLSAIEQHLAYEEKYLVLLDGIMRFLLYLDHGCGFYLYTFTGVLFRRELKKFFYELLYLICRRRVLNWSAVESRRHSELSASNGPAWNGRVLSFQQQYHGNSHVQESTSSCGGVKTSFHSLHHPRTSSHTSYHQYPLSKQNPINSLSTSPSSRAGLSPSIEHQHSFNNTTIKPAGLVKRHSSSCFESQYNTAIVQLTSLNSSVAHELDRKNDIV